ncbi:MAG: class I SAM-dependent DNA methyltransferase [Thermus sp.]|uniref:HsdM family class I SAM-dependent methyltransferase n=1 Tax=Thermus sp. TaxID=275 RepID=UPI00391BAE8C
MGNRFRNLDPLARWLTQTAQLAGRPERSYYPEIRVFISGLLGYPEGQVVTEDRAGSGIADFLIYTDHGYPWVAGEFKLDDEEITDSSRNEALWQEKRKYLTGTIRYLIFLTPSYLQLRDQRGRIVHPSTYLSLREIGLEALRQALGVISAEQGVHQKQWEAFVQGKLPYAYLKLPGPDGLHLQQLRRDLSASFWETTIAAEKALTALEEQFRAYKKELHAIDSLKTLGEDYYQRAKARVEGSISPAVKELFEVHLPRFAEQFGRDVEASRDEWGVVVQSEIREAFLADSVGAIIAKVLFVRFLEDLGLIGRRLTNGGLKSWGKFMKYLAGNAKALLKVTSLDLKEAFPEPFGEETFSWILESNGKMDAALQHLLLRVNAYDFSGLSEEIVGDIYQNFLPPAKRKRLGEFYTPKEVVDFILKEAVFSLPQDYPRILDPACGSGTFLVRYLHARIEDAKQRGVHLDPEELAQSVWGFDINPFASYVSAFQVLWGLLRAGKKGGDLRVHVYALNSLLDDTEMRTMKPDLFSTPGEKARDEERWDCVVGNPPYIRAERAKHGERLRIIYKHLWDRNIDTGILLLWRAMRGSGAGTERGWVRDGGRLGMVVSGGYASNEAAAQVWNLLVPGNAKTWSLRKLVWLEFAGKIWDANVIPMILILEKTPPKEEDRVEIWVPQAWPKEKPEAVEQTSIQYRDFFDPKVNPWAEGSEGEKGPLLLPLLKEEDIPLLSKLHPENGNTVSLNHAMETQYHRGRGRREYWWTYGIKRAGAPVLPCTGSSPSEIAVLAGDRLAVAFAGEPVGCVNLESVEGKSLWGGSPFPDRFIALQEINRAPSAVLIHCSDTPVAALNTVVVGVPKKDLGEAVTAYLNSSLVRWYYLVRLRSGVLEGSSRAHIYPRTLEALPWPKGPDPELLKRLAAAYIDLEELANISRYAPDNWLLDQVEEAKGRNDGYRLRSPHLGIDFRGWTDAIPPEEIHISGTKLVGNLLTEVDLQSEELAQFVHLLLRIQASADEPEEEREVDARTLQELFIPNNYKDLLKEYQEKQVAFSKVEQGFHNKLREIDDLVFDLFRLASEEKRYILNRLESFPLNLLPPRYPWEVRQTARSVLSYQEDRYQ